MSHLRVLSFNVRYDTPADGEQSWANRREMVASVVRFHRPALVGLQEPLAHQLSYLRESLPAYEWVGVGREDGAEAGEFVPIGVRSDRLAVVEWSTRWLSPTPTEPGSRDPDAAHPRILTRATVRDAETGTTFRAHNTHFDHESAAARRRGARQLRRTVAGTDRPTIVTGDLNCTPGSTPYRLLTRGAGPEREAKGGAGIADADASRPLRDAHEVATYHHGPTATFGQFSGRPTERIDYVLVTDGVAVRQHGVLADHWDGRVPSDHRPVLAEVRVEE